MQTFSVFHAPNLYSVLGTSLSTEISSVQAVKRGHPFTVVFLSFLSHKSTFPEDITDSKPLPSTNPVPFRDFTPQLPTSARFPLNCHCTSPQHPIDYHSRHSGTPATNVSGSQRLSLPRATGAQTCLLLKLHTANLQRHNNQETPVNSHRHCSSSKSWTWHFWSISLSASRCA